MICDPIPVKPNRSANVVGAFARGRDDEVVVSAEEAIGERLTLDTLVDLALKFPDRSDPYSNRREEYRLVGVIDQLMPGTTVAPAASQTHGATVVLAHLRYGEPPNAEPDVNSRDDGIQDAPPALSN